MMRSANFKGEVTLPTTVKTPKKEETAPETMARMVARVEAMKHGGNPAVTNSDASCDVPHVVQSPGGTVKSSSIRWPAGGGSDVSFRVAI
eukprot:8538262-Pyramimonas_sp.AAC.1